MIAIRWNDTLVNRIAVGKVGRLVGCEPIKLRRLDRRPDKLILEFQISGSDDWAEDSRLQFAWDSATCIAGTTCDTGDPCSTGEVLCDVADEAHCIAIDQLEDCPVE